MSVKLPSQVSDQAKWYPIDLGAGQSFDLQIRRPTFSEHVTTLATPTPEEHTKARFSTMIVDWRGVEDGQEPPQPIKYSLDALVQLVQVYPQSFRQITAALNDAFHVWPGDLEKNLPTPPANGGTTTTDETTVSTTSSNSGEPSGGKSDSVASSAAS